MASQNELLSVLGTYTSPLSDTTTHFCATNKEKNLESTTFQLSIFLKSLLDQLEGRKILPSGEDGDRAYAAVVLNAEYALTKLWAATELRFNPFLKHWVEVVERTDPYIRLTFAGQGQTLPVSEGWILVHAARLEIIKGALGVKKLDEAASPSDLVASVQTTRYAPINLEPFIDLLDSQGLLARPKPGDSNGTADSLLHSDDFPQQLGYDGIVSDAEYTSPAQNARGGGSSGSPDSSVASLLDLLSAQIAQNATPQADLFDSALKQAPGDALGWLIRLPPTLAALDYATKILTSGIVESLGVGAGDIARQHLQHMLRHVEALGSDRSESGGGGEDPGRHQQGQGAEQQSRAVTLLTVYVRNLLSRHIVDFHTVSLDVQEICVRYIWVPQVREFRAWVEANVLGRESPPLDGSGD